MADRQLTANFSASTAGFSAGTNILKQKLNELNTHMEQTKQAVKSANSEIKQYEKELTQLRRETNNGSTATTEQKNRMQELRDRIARTTSELGTLRTAEQELRSQIRSTNQELNNQQSAVQQIQSAAASMGDVLKANLASSAIQSAVGKLTSSLKTAADYCYNVGSSFEAGMSQVAAISGATSAELEKLTEKAKALGASTKFTATQVAEAMNYMAMAGWNAEQMLSGIDGVMNLAAASGGDLAQTSDIVTDAITAFGLKAEDVGHFADVLAAASANANTNVSMMGETFSYCAPIAGALGFSIEDVSEAIGLMANSGVKSSMAGTALRTLFTKLSDDIKITGQNLGEVTIQTSNADGSMRSLKNIVTDMRAAFSQLSESEKSSAAESIAGKYAMTGLLTLMNAGSEDVDKLRGAIENCDGATSDMAETMQNNAAGAVTIMQSALEGLGIAVYDKFGDKLKDEIGNVTDMLSSLTDRVEAGEFDDVFQRITESLGDAAEQFIDFAEKGLPSAIESIADLITFLLEYRNVVAGVIGTMVTFKTAMSIGKTITGLVSSIKSVTSAVRTAETATQALTAAQATNNAVAAANPYVAVASAILALVGGIATLILTTDNATDKVADLRSKTNELNSTAKESRKATTDVKALADEYQSLKSSADDTEEAKQRLKDIQDILIDTYDIEADKIDLVNGKYEEQLGIISQIVDKKSDEARRDATTAYNSMRSLEETERNTKYTDSSEEMDGFLKFSSTAMALRDSRVRKLLEEVSQNNDNITIGDETFGWGGYDGYNISVTGSTSEKAKAYKEIVEAFEKSGLDNDNSSYVTGYYKAWVDSYNKYKEADEKNREVISNYEDVTGHVAVGYHDNDDYTANSWMYEKYQKTGDSETRPKSSDTQEEPPPESTSSEKGAFGVDWSDYNSVKRYYKYMQDTGQIGETKYLELIEYFANKLLDPDSDEWRSATAEIYQARNKSGKDPNEEAYDSDQKYLKWRLDMWYITEAQYYEQLAALRDKYLDESSDKWRSATLAIHKYQEQKNKEKLDTIKDQYDAAVSAIDDRIKQHDRDREDEDTDKKIAEVEKQLEYDRLDDYSRQQLENKKQELLDEKEETQWQREQEDIKDELSTVYAMAKEAYEQGTEDLSNALAAASAVFSAIGTGAQQTASTVSTVNNNSVSMVMNAVSQTSDQIAAAVIKALSSSI